MTAIAPKVELRNMVNDFCLTIGLRVNVQQFYISDIYDIDISDICDISDISDTCPRHGCLVTSLALAGEEGVDRKLCSLVNRGVVTVI